MSRYVRRLCVSTDIEGYSAHTYPEQEDAQRRLVQVTDYVCQRARIIGVDRQVSGDGGLLMLRPGVNEARVLPSLILGLRHALYETNRNPGPFGRIRIRAAICQGAVTRSPNGYVGDAVVAAARLINSAQVRAGLTAREAADLALAMPNDLFEEMRQLGHPGLTAAAFTRIAVREKSYDAVAWLHNPESGPADDPYARKVPWIPVAAAMGAGAAATAAIVITHPPHSTPTHTPTHHTHTPTHHTPTPAGPGTAASLARSGLQHGLTGVHHAGTASATPLRDLLSRQSDDDPDDHDHTPPDDDTSPDHDPSDDSTDYSSSDGSH